jgi:hypothetical protein
MSHSYSSFPPPLPTRRMPPPPLPPRVPASSKPMASVFPTPDVTRTSAQAAASPPPLAPPPLHPRSSLASSPVPPPRPPSVLAPSLVHPSPVISTKQKISIELSESTKEALARYEACLSRQDALCASGDPNAALAAFLDWLNAERNIWERFYGAKTESQSFEAETQSVEARSGTNVQDAMARISLDTHRHAVHSNSDPPPYMLQDTDISKHAASSAPASMHPPPSEAVNDTASPVDLSADLPASSNLQFALDNYNSLLPKPRPSFVTYINTISTKLLAATESVSSDAERFRSAQYSLPLSYSDARTDHAMWYNECYAPLVSAFEIGKGRVQELFEALIGAPNEGGSGVPLEDDDQESWARGAEIAFEQVERMHMLQEEWERDRREREGTLNTTLMYHTGGDDVYDRVRQVRSFI